MEWPICDQVYTTFTRKPIILNCEHSMCQQCANQWFEMNLEMKCPQWNSIDVQYDNENPKVIRAFLDLVRQTEIECACPDAANLICLDTLQTFCPNWENRAPNCELVELDQSALGSIQSIFNQLVQDVGDQVSETKLKIAQTGNMQNKFDLIVEMRNLDHGILCDFSESHLATLLCLENALAFWRTCATNERPNGEIINLVDSQPQLQEQINQLLPDYENYIDDYVKEQAQSSTIADLLSEFRALKIAENVGGYVYCQEALHSPSERVQATLICKTCKSFVCRQCVNTIHNGSVCELKNLNEINFKEYIVSEIKNAELDDVSQRDQIWFRQIDYKNQDPMSQLLILRTLSLKVPPLANNSLNNCSGCHLPYFSNRSPIELPCNSKHTFWALCLNSEFEKNFELKCLECNTVIPEIQSIEDIAGLRIAAHLLNSETEIINARNGRLANKGGEELNCPICSDQYNMAVRRPKRLPCCTQIMCQQCLSKVLVPQRSAIQAECVFCRNPLSIRTAQDYQDDGEIVDYIRDNSLMCSNHQDSYATQLCISPPQAMCLLCARWHDNGNMLINTYQRDISTDLIQGINALIPPNRAQLPENILLQVNRISDMNDRDLYQLLLDINVWRPQEPGESMQQPELKLTRFRELCPKNINSARPRTWEVRTANQTEAVTLWIPQKIIITGIGVGCDILADTKVDYVRFTSSMGTRSETEWEGVYQHVIPFQPDQKVARLPVDYFMEVGLEKPLTIVVKYGIGMRLYWGDEPMIVSPLIAPNGEEITVGKAFFEEGDRENGFNEKEGPILEIYYKEVFSN